jgi:mono/diheme cytochrome c family protein
VSAATKIAVLACSLAACSAPESRPSESIAPHEPSPPPVEAAVDIDLDDEAEPEVVVDGRYLYTRNCAGCHNDNGDGLGPTIVQLGKRARSFAEGHFAFGNTRESIFRTIGSGVPGSSPMPGFAGILSDEERWMVVDYVRTLMPPEPEVDPSAGIMRVEKTPLFVRGLLPPIVEGAPERPRGLLVGTPGGLTFEYRTDDVRLLGVRRGEFADRRDWSDRGGTQLAPLGELIWTAQGGDPGPPLAIIRDEAQMPVIARLLGTAVRGDTAMVVYRWRLESKKTAERFDVNVVELCADTPLSDATGFTRHIEMKSDREDASAMVNLAGSLRDEAWVRGVEGEEVDFVGLPTRELPADGWLVGQRGENDFECVHVRAPKGSKLVVQSGAVGVIVMLPAAMNVVLEATIVLTSDASPEHLERLSEEIR